MSTQPITRQEAEMILKELGNTQLGMNGVRTTVAEIVGVLSETESRPQYGPSRDDLKAMFPLLWHINDHLRITPDQGVEYTGSTNDVDNLRERLHKLDPNFDLGTSHEGVEHADVMEVLAEAEQAEEAARRG